METDQRPTVPIPSSLEKSSDYRLGCEGLAISESKGAREDTPQETFKATSNLDSWGSFLSGVPLALGQPHSALWQKLKAFKIFLRETFSCPVTALVHLTPGSSLKSACSLLKCPLHPHSLHSSRRYDVPHVSVILSMRVPAP